VSCPHSAHIGRDSGPVDMHVGRQRRRRRTVGEPPLLLAHLGKVHAEAAEFLGHGHLQIARLAQFFEVFAKETILAVVGRGAISASVDECFREHRGSSHCRPFITLRALRAVLSSRDLACQYIFVNCLQLIHQGPEVPRWVERLLVSGMCASSSGEQRLRAPKTRTH
jgi:hypothetical protein